MHWETKWPGHRIELIMDIFLLPFIFSVWAAIPFLLLLQVIVSRCNIIQCTRFLIMTSTQVTWQSLNWIGFLFWTFMNSYTGRFWLSFLCWMFIVPIVLFTFFRSIYNFGPEHCKQSFFDILSNPVPGIEFKGRDGESNALNSFRQRCFNHNLVARRIARNKHLSAKQVTQSSTVIVHDCPLSNINASALKLHGYKTMLPFIIH
jgi:hypothetical protein